MATIKISNQKREIPSGVIEASKLYEACSTETLYINVFDEYIPVEKNDHVLITDNMHFTTETLPNVPENPLLKNSLSLKVNEKSHTISQAKITYEDIAKFDTELVDCEVYVDLKLDNVPDFHLNVGVKLIVQDEVTFITIPKSVDGIVDIEECANHSRSIPKFQKQYRIKIDGEKFVTSSSSLTGKEILEVAGIEWQRFDLQKKFSDGKREQIEYEDIVNLSDSCLIERFETIPREAQQGERWKQG